MEVHSSTKDLALENMDVTGSNTESDHLVVILKVIMILTIMMKMTMIVMVMREMKVALMIIG